MFKELKNKTDEVLRTRHSIAFIVMVINLAVSLIFLFPLILMLASGHDSDSYWQLYIIISTFCLFLLALFYNRVISKEMNERIAGPFDNFSEFYQKSLIRRLIIGLLIGSSLWFTIFLVSNLFYFMQIEDIWFETFLHDLPLVGAILALLVSLQIWGLLPQPTNSDENEQMSKDKEENNRNQDFNREQLDSEEIPYKESSK